VARGDEAADVEAEAEGGDAGGEEAAVGVGDDAEHRGCDGGVLAEEAEAVSNLDHEEDVRLAGLEVDDLLLQRRVALASPAAAAGRVQGRSGDAGWSDSRSLRRTTSQERGVGLGRGSLLWLALVVLPAHRTSAAAWTPCCR